MTKTKIFYDHLVEIEEITIEVNSYKIDKNEKNEILSLVDETFHHHTLRVILDHLPFPKHEEFLQKFYQSPFDLDLLDFLKKEIEVDIEEIIKTESKKIKQQILKEIKETAGQ